MGQTTKGIVYPSDYAEVADIPQDMKELAESADGILQNIEDRVEILEQSTIAGYTKAEVDELLDDKVDKVTGKGLSTNDFTNEYKAQIDTNAIDIVALGTNKADKTELPTKTSDLTNDSGFIDKNVNNLTYYTLTTQTGSQIELSINSTDYKMTAVLKDKNGNVVYTSNVIDLPLETMVVNATYDRTTKEIVLTLQNGTTVRFSVADLVSGLQAEITAINKLASDLVDDTNQTNKFVTSAEKTAWNNKENSSNKVISISASSTNTQYPSAKAVYDYIASLDAEEVAY